MIRLLPLVLVLAACAGQTTEERAVVFATDLLKPAEQRCREAQEVYATLTGTPAEMAGYQALVVAACMEPPG